MGKINWFPALAAAAVITTSAVALSAPNSHASAPTLSQTDPLQITLDAKDLPMQKIEDRTLVFAETRAARWQREATQNATP